MAKPDPVRLEVMNQLLAAVCEEAGALLQRTAISPNIRARRDFSCALFDGDGRLIAQAAHIPVHLGSAGDSVAAVRRHLTLEPGDVAVLNDPFAGGTHLPDITLVRPVFFGTRLVFFVVCRAHHADIGGATPGSMAVATELFAEGLVLPPVKLRARDEPVYDVRRLIAANVRGPTERLADLNAQEACLRHAEQRLRALVEVHGLDRVLAYAGHLIDYADRVATATIAALPRRAVRAEDVLEDDGTGDGPFAVRLRLRASPEALTFDWTGSAPQARGGINANRSVVMAACVYVLRCLCPDRLPTNEGVFRRVQVRTEPGSLLDPRPPAAVAGGNVETSQRLVDVALRALAQLAPDRVPADSAGTMSNLTLGGTEDGKTFSFYETLPGGAGAGPDCDGTSAVQTHMTNTRNTPVEELERVLPVRVRRLTIRRGSGGRGRHRGGDGLIKEIELLAPATVSLFAERHRTAPAGLAGGAAGRPARAARGLDGRWRRLPAKGSERLPAGARVVVETPGGGGWGEPERSR